MIRPALLRTSMVVSVITAALLLVSNAEAHAKLVSTTPQADATVASPQLIQVRFNEAIAVKLSTLQLTGSDGAKVSIMSMNDAKDPSTLSIMPNAKLKAGVYRVSWKIVSDDGHKEQGTFSFTVQ